jgi:hypothetical protein
MANFKWYGKGLLALANGDIAFDTDTFKVMLATSSYTPNQDTDQFRSSVTANEITGTGYTAGGQTLAGVATSYDATTNEVRILWTDSAWTTASFTARIAVIYKSRGGADTADELVAYLDMVSDQTVTASTFTLDYTTSVLKITAS